MNKKGNNKQMKEEFGLLLHNMRKQKKMTQEDLSELTGITDVYLRDLERGNYTATWVIWLKLCTVLNINIEEFQKKYIIPELSETRKNMKQNPAKENILNL